ncbi:MAG: hypothetical protein LKM43_04780 [Wolbachia endosymbiont of Penenirmus auritus]|nr:hypothetical protein [Wolbachia endosymbiont of Penenirmus auritus]
MPAGLTFHTKEGNPADNVNVIKNIVYEDSRGNQYTFGVNDSNVFSTFKYKPQNGSEVNYSATAKNFVENGAVAALLDIGAEVGKIKTNIDKLDPVSTGDGTLGKVLSGIKAEAAKITGVDTKVIAIKAKTDNMPDNLNTELDSLTKMGNLINSMDLDQAARLALQKNFKKVVTDTISNPANSADLNEATKSALQDNFSKAVIKTIEGPNFQQDVQPILQANLKKAAERVGGSAQTWFENNVRNAISKPVLEIPADDNEPLNWDW